jgi:hypothetical protein
VVIAISGSKRKQEKMVHAMKPPKQQGVEETQERIHKIRITLSSKNVKNIEKGTPT